MFTLVLDGFDERSYDYSGPFGRRFFQKAAGGSVNGAAMQGQVLPLLANDYGRLSDDGSIHAFHASITLQANDGTVVLMQYRGRRSPRYAQQSRIQAIFQAPEGAYGWFNGIQAIGYGRQEGGQTIFDVYALTGEAAVEGADDNGPVAAKAHVPAEFLLRRKSEHIAGATRHVIAAPLGERYFTLAEGGGAFAGPKLRGEFVSGYSWSPHRMSKTNDNLLMQYDVETLLETDDGVPILMSYTGASSAEYGAGKWMTASLFETTAESYAWLNEVQAVGFGRWAGDGAEYTVYALT